MNVFRRVLPEISRRGWCPSLARPMPTGDGLLARIHPPLGILTRVQLRAVAEASETFGNGHVDVTARANLQLRGVTEAARAGLVAALTAVGLGDVRDDGGPQRLTLTSPLAGLIAEAIDVPALARAIERLSLGIGGLPAKTLVLIAGDTDLSGIDADLHVRATAPGIAAIGIAEDDGVAWVAEVREADVADTVAEMLAGFTQTGHRRVRDLTSPERCTLAQIAKNAPADCTATTLSPRQSLPEASRARWDEFLDAPTGPLSRSGEGWGEGSGPSGKLTPLTLSVSRTGEGTRVHIGPRARGKPRVPGVVRTNMLRTEAPFGRCTAVMLDRLADVAEALGVDEIRLSPSRGFVLAASGPAPDALAELTAVGFITAPDDPRRAVATCPGAPACASGSTPTGADAARLAEAFRPFAARGMTAHVSGCAKGCAHPSRADLTLVARDGRYGIVVDGAPGDAPAPELTFEAALERVWRAKSGTLAQAFATSSFGRRDGAEPAIGTMI